MGRLRHNSGSSVLLIFLIGAYRIGPPHELHNVPTSAHSGSSSARMCPKTGRFPPIAILPASSYCSMDALLKQPSPGTLSHIESMLQHIPDSASYHASCTRYRTLRRHRRRSCIVLWHTYCSWTSLEPQSRKYPHTADPSECILSSSPHHVHPNMRCNNGYRLPYSASIPRYIVEIVHVTSYILLSVLAIIGITFFKVVCN